MALKSAIKHYSEAWRREDRAHGSALVVIFLAGLGIRIVYLFQPITHDEAVNYMYFAARPLSYGLSHYPYPNNHLLNTFLIHWSTRIFGNDPWAIRLPAFLAGLALLPATYLLARRIYDRNAALLAAALVAASSFLIEYSTLGRAFSIQALVFILGVLVALNLMRKAGPAWWAAFVALGVLGFYATPTMLYFFGAVALWMLVTALAGGIPGGKRLFVIQLAAACACCGAVVFLLYLPVILNSGLRSLTSNEWVKPLTLSAFARGLPAALRNYQASWSSGWTQVTGVVLTLGVVISASVHKRIGHTRINILYPVVGWCLLVVLVQRILPPARVWLPLLPLFLGMSAAGLVFAGGRIVSRIHVREAGRWPGRAGFPALVVAILALCCSLVLLGNAPYQPPDQVRLRDAPAITRLLKPILQDGDVVYAEPNIRKMLEYYFMKYDVADSYLFMIEEKDRCRGPFKRAYIVAGDGEGYTLDMTMSSTNLKRGMRFSLSKVAQLPHSTVYLISSLAVESGGE